VTLEGQEISHTDGCLVNEALILDLTSRVANMEGVYARIDALVAMESGLSGRLQRIEESLGLRDNAQTAIALSEGAAWDRAPPRRNGRL